MINIEVLREIHKTLKESIKIEAVPVLHKDLKIWESNFGGIPYIPMDMEYPRNTSGEPLYLLAQINFIDMPFLKPFPRDGLLQFYVDKNVCDNSDACEHKVLYIPHPEHYNNHLDLHFIENPQDFPIQCPHRLTYCFNKKPISSLNPCFEKVFSKYLTENNEQSDDFYDLYSELINDFNSHQIGGYSSFIQEAPNFIKEDIENFEVLLQINSDTHITFGDSGIATFFIRREDLASMDFSKVIFYWDSC